MDFKGPYRVSKYGVNTKNLEKVGVQALTSALQSADLIVVDEIGKMELFSEAPKQKILEALDSKKLVLGTIMQASHPFADQIKKRKDTKVLEVTPENREQMATEIVKTLGF